MSEQIHDSWSLQLLGYAKSLASFSLRKSFQDSFLFLFFISFIIDRYNDGTVKLRNPNIELMDQDILYHLALGSGSHDLQEMFGDVKVSCQIKSWKLSLNSIYSQFVCMGGTPKRMENFAHFIMEEIGYKLPAGTQLQDISAFSYRYSMYKVRISIKSRSIEWRNIFSKLVSISESTLSVFKRPRAISPCL